MADPIDILVGCRLRARRRELGLTQDDLASALGVRFQQVQKYETAANRIAASRLYRAAGALRVSVDWFFNQPSTPAIRATDGRPDCSCLDSLLARVKGAPAEMRLAILKQAVVEDGGRWDLPSDAPGIYQPALMSIQVFGVFAAADNLEELAINWMRAAENTLAGKREVV